MMTQNKDKKRGQIQIFCMDDMVPQDHLLRIIDKAIDWNFIYGLVVDKYSPDNGRPVPVWHQKHAADRKGNRSKCSLSMVSWP